MRSPGGVPEFSFYFDIFLLVEVANETGPENRN